MIKQISECRICQGQHLVQVMDLGVQALTGIFPRDRDENIGYSPIQLIKCNTDGGCGLVQLRHSYQPEEMYGVNYGYRSGLNAHMVRHLKSKVKEIMDRGILNENDLIIDIGSNDGTTLSNYPRHKYQLVGIDPTADRFKEYYPCDVFVIPDFFSAQAVSKHFGGKKAKIITSFAMFYDLEDPVGFAREIEATLHDDGVWVFEQSYLPLMLKQNSFDTICHEHLEFYSLKQIMWIASLSGLKIIDVTFNEVNGGSFSVTACKAKAKYTSHESLINKTLEDEVLSGIDGMDAMEQFHQRVNRERDALLTFLHQTKKDGKSVAAIGASTKGNVLLQYYQIDDEMIYAVGEVNQDKFGCFTPGTNIPILPEDDVLASNPDYLLILPWHFRSYFEQSPKFKDRVLVFPLDKFEVVYL